MQCKKLEMSWIEPWSYKMIEPMAGPMFSLSCVISDQFSKSLIDILRSFIFARFVIRDFLNFRELGQKT